MEYDDLCLTHVSPGHFVEESQLASARAWRHERTVEPTPNGCRVTDQLTVRPRWLVPSAIVRVAVGAIFTHRHRRLDRLSGTPRS